MNADDVLANALAQAKYDQISMVGKKRALPRFDLVREEEETLAR